MPGYSKQILCFLITNLWLCSQYVIISIISLFSHHQPMVSQSYPYIFASFCRWQNPNFGITSAQRPSGPAFTYPLGNGKPIFSVRRFSSSWQPGHAGPGSGALFLILFKPAQCGDIIMIYGLIKKCWVLGYVKRKKAWVLKQHTLNAKEWNLRLQHLVHPSSGTFCAGSLCTHQKLEKRVGLSSNFITSWTTNWRVQYYLKSFSGIIRVHRILPNIIGDSTI